jgi:hypothetical protein
MQQELSIFMFLLQVKDKMGNQDRTNGEKNETPNPKISYV